MQYTFQIQAIPLPNGPFELFIPVAEKVVEIYLARLEENPKEPSPYWARLWPSAIALASFIQRHTNYVTGKKVAELAAGIGLPSLVAAKYAQQVWCSDLVQHATQMAARSAEHHGLQNISFGSCNWNDLPSSLNPEVLLLSDVNYDPEVFDSLWVVLEGFLQKGATILLSTPERLMAKTFIEKLLPFVVEQTVGDEVMHSDAAAIHIFVLQKP